MVNSQVTQEIINALKLNVSAEKIPNPIPVTEVSMKHSKSSLIYTDIRTTSGSPTGFSPPTGTDCYIRSVTLGFVKDATCDKADGSSNFNVVINGKTTYFYIPVLTLTAQQVKHTWNFKPAMKIDKNSTVNWAGDTFTAGKFIRSIEIEYFIDDASNG